MINVIDRIQYLPKDRSSILDVNEITNHAHKMIVDNIKKTVRRVNTHGHRATVTVTGKVQKSSTRNNFSVKIECEDEAVKSAIHDAITK